MTHTQPLTVRFSEVDSMHLVWHGNHLLYFEDAREGFGRAYGLDYLTIRDAGYYAPLVDVEIHYRRPIIYGMMPAITIAYQPTDAAKIIFNYTIFNTDDNQVLATGRTVQVFLDTNYQLVWSNPPFYEQWKQKWLSK